MVFSLCVDSREHHVLAKLSLPHTIAQLEIGDFHVLADGIPRFVIERKTVSDLESSIKDGRYAEQKSRATTFMNQFDIQTKIQMIYVLEGSNKFSFDDTSSASKMLTGAVMNTVFRDMIPFIFTKDIDETIAFIHCLIARASKYEDVEKKPYIACLVASVASAASRKKDNVDKKTCLVLQLCCIPGISTKKAESIISHHHVESMSDLLEKMKKEGQEVDPVAFFKETNGIGKILAKTIFEFLL